MKDGQLKSIYLKDEIAGFAVTVESETSSYPEYQKIDAQGMMMPTVFSQAILHRMPTRAESLPPEPSTKYVPARALKNDSCSWLVAAPPRKDCHGWAPRLTKVEVRAGLLPP